MTAGDIHKRRGGLGRPRNFATRSLGKILSWKAENGVPPATTTSSLCSPRNLGRLRRLSQALGPKGIRHEFSEAAMLAESAGNTRHVTGDLPVIYRPVSMMGLAFLHTVPKLIVLLQGQLGWSVSAVRDNLETTMRWWRADRPTMAFFSFVGIEGI